MTNQQNIEKLEKQVKEFFDCKLEYNFKYEISHSRAIVTHSTKSIHSISTVNVINCNNTIIVKIIIVKVLVIVNGLGKEYSIDNIALTELFKHKTFQEGYKQNKQISKQINNILKIQILTHVIVHDILPYSNNQSKT